MSFNLRKILSTNILSNGNYDSSIIIISEGFTRDMEIFFWNSCQKLLKCLKNYYPFSLTSYARDRNLTIYGCFVPSDSSGPSLDFEENGNKTAFGSYLDIENECLILDAEKIKKKLSELSILRDGIHDNVLDVFFQNEYIEKKNIIVFLVPEIEEFSFGGECAYFNEDLSYAGTTLNGYWEQVIFKAIGHLAGLADEFELEGEEYLKPKEKLNWNLINLNPNLLSYFEIDGRLKNADILWRDMIPMSQQNNNIRINKSSFHPNAPDYEIPKYNYAPDQIELIEGGGGYRTDTFRSSHDCIMRRKFGSKMLPIRKEKISFCKICEAVLLERLQLGRSLRMGQLKANHSEDNASIVNG